MMHKIQDSDYAKEWFKLVFKNTNWASKWDDSPSNIFLGPCVIIGPVELDGDKIVADQSNVHRHFYEVTLEEYLELAGQ